MTRQVTIKVRQDLAAKWYEKNPVLAAGEFGLELDFYLLKVGNGELAWRDLPYLNKLDPTYFQWAADGTIQLSDAFNAKIQEIIDKLDAPLIITNDPVAATDPVNKRYVDAAIASVGQLKRKIVETLPTEDIDEHTVYMVQNPNTGDYDEYMFIDGIFARIGNNRFELNIATTTQIGGVLSSSLDNHISVDSSGFMTLNRVSTSLLYVPDGDSLTINGGHA